MNTSDAKIHSVRKYEYIDALRGYAVLFVITCHTAGNFFEMPSPVKNAAQVGWHGVQLFFLVSCVTLMMSWRSDEKKGIANPLSFWRRRFFRIAPMYYLAAAFYFVFEPPPNGFVLAPFLATITFINAWSPRWIPTVPDAWMVVQGGWSVGVEFMFYLAFPLIVTTVRSTRAAAAFFALSLIIAGVTNNLAHADLVVQFGEAPTSNFLYFWLPNQMPIFAMGTLLFFAIDAARKTRPEFLTRYPLAIIAACAIIFLFFAEIPIGGTEYFSFRPLDLVPMILIESTVLWVAALVLSANPNIILINRPIRALGEVSFSAYILHFFVIHRLAMLPVLFDLHRTGYAAIATFVGLWCAAVPITYGLSRITYRFIEKPMIEFGKPKAARAS